jgi:hypothetical protein
VRSSVSFETLSYPLTVPSGEDWGCRRVGYQQGSRDRDEGMELRAEEEFAYICNGRTEGKER